MHALGDINDKGAECIRIRYVAMVLELVKAKNAIEVGGVAKLASTLEAVSKGVLQ